MGFPEFNCNKRHRNVSLQKSCMLTVYTNNCLPDSAFLSPWVTSVHNRLSNNTPDFILIQSDNIEITMPCDITRSSLSVNKGEESYMLNMFINSSPLPSSAIDQVTCLLTNQATDNLSWFGQRVGGR